MPRLPTMFSLFFFNDTATTEIYTLSLHDALPIFSVAQRIHTGLNGLPTPVERLGRKADRSEEHTSELQSHLNLVCRLLLEKKNTEQVKTRTTSKGLGKEAVRAANVVTYMRHTRRY